MDELLPVEPVRPPSPARRRLFVVVTLVLLAAFVVVAGLEGSGFIVRSGPAPTLEPTEIPATPARLAFVDLDGALGVMNTAQSSVLHLPSAGATFQFPAWSPDGTRVAAVRTDGRGTSLDVFALPPGGNSGDEASAPTTIYTSDTEPAFYLYWAPDSRAVAFLTTEPDGLALRHAAADATGSATVIRKGAPMYWQWVDPTRLLVHSGGSSLDAFAGEVGLDGARAGSATLGTGPFRAPAISSDGRYVAFSSAGDDGSMAVTVASRDGSSRHDVAILGPPAFEFDPAGDTLAFTASAEAGASVELPIGPLRTLDASTGVVRTLLDASVVTFFWAPDGKTIAAISIPQPGDTKVASSISGNATLARADTHASPAATGVALRLTFVDMPSGAVRSARDLTLAELFINQVLPYFDQYALSHRFWSPDSRSIVLPIVGAQGGPRITTFFADGSDPMELLDGQFASWSP